MLHCKFVRRRKSGTTHRSPSFQTLWFVSDKRLR